MKKQLQGYVIPSKSVFDVGDKVREMFLYDDCLHDNMTLHHDKTIDTDVYLQVFVVGQNRVFIRLVGGSGLITYPEFTADDIGGRFLDYTDDTVTRRERAFCEKIEGMITGRRYMLIPVFNYHALGYYGYSALNNGNHKSDA